MNQIIGNSIYKYLKKSIHIIESLDNLLSYIIENIGEVGQIIEQFRLDLAIKYLNLEYLEKRINGLLEINELIELASNKESMYVN